MRGNESERSGELRSIPESAQLFDLVVTDIAMLKTPREPTVTRSQRTGEEHHTRLTNLVGQPIYRSHDEPMKFRLILQPAVAVFFVLRDCLKDSRGGNVPNFWALLTEPARGRNGIVMNFH
jgi:hypothetical protein